MFTQHIIHIIIRGFKWDVVRSGRHKEWGPLMPVPKVKSRSKSYLHVVDTV